MSLEKFERMKNIIGTWGSKFEPRSPFVRSFSEGTILGFIVLVLLISWLYLRQDKTAEKLQSVIPFKTVMIEVPDVEQAIGGTPDVKLDAQKNINALPQAPISGFMEEVDGKYWPVINEANKALPFDAYKKPFSVVDGKAMVSIVVVDYGLSEKVSQEILNNFPSEISFVLNPYAEDPVKWANAARSFGREFWVSIPMQTKDFGISDTGPMTLLKNVMDAENLNRLKNIMGISQGYAGFVTEKNHDFDSDPKKFGAVLNEVKSRGLGFVESNPDIIPLGIDMDAAFAQNDIWLDTDLRPDAVSGALKSIEQKAQRDGSVIVFTHPYPIVMKSLQGWFDEIKSQNIQLVPLSYLASQK